MRRKLRDPVGGRVYARRKGIVGLVFGVLKEQRGMRQFRRRGLQKVGVEFALAATAFNLTRLGRLKPALAESAEGEPTSSSEEPDRIGEENFMSMNTKTLFPNPS
jgi:Transposase DDE domain